MVAVHSAVVSELYVPYIRPAENGNRTNCDWIQLNMPPIQGCDSSGGQSAGVTGLSTPSTPSSPRVKPSNHLMSLTVRCPQRFNFSAQPYTTEDLSLATHSHILERFPRNFISLNIDPFLMGVGGDDDCSVSTVHEDNLLYCGTVYEFDCELGLAYTNLET